MAGVVVRLKRVFAALGSLVLGISPLGRASGQILHAKGPLPSFEVATVKPWKPPVAAPTAGGNGLPVKVMQMSPVGAVGQRTERVHVIGQVSILLASAYNLPVESRGRIVGAPDWVFSQGERYEISAKIDDATFGAMRGITATEQQGQVSLMEQALLADRFKLKVHFETREMPVYALVVAKGGVKVTPAAEGEASNLAVVTQGQVSEMTAQAVAMGELVKSPLLRVGGRLVMDQTGLNGRYDFALKWGADMTAAGSDEPSLFTAIREQLGLRLVATKAAVEVIVIDRIERPSEN